MINHLTGFLNKWVLVFKRDNHLETSSSVKLGTFCVTNDEFLGDYPLPNTVTVPAFTRGQTDRFLNCSHIMKTRAKLFLCFPL